MKLAKVQSESLTALKPTISYIVNNNRLNLIRTQKDFGNMLFDIPSGFDYELNEDGLLKSMSPRQFLPRTEDTSLVVSGIQFAFPAGKADPISGEVIYYDLVTLPLWS